MMRRNGTAFVLAICAMALGFSLAGCASGAASSSSEDPKANSAFILQVNETMVELDERLDLFVDAVSRGDVVNMRTQAENAYAVLDKLDSIEAPEKVAAVKADYVDGAKKLREALDSYIELYTESVKDDGSVDKADFDKRIAEIQAVYDEGVALMQKADKAAVEMSAESASSQSSASTSSESSGDAAGSASVESEASRTSPRG